jgi:hypothetical protein
MPVMILAIERMTKGNCPLFYKSFDRHCQLCRFGLRKGFADMDISERLFCVNPKGIQGDLFSELHDRKSIHA